MMIKFSTDFRGMLVDAIVRARDFIGNPTAKPAIIKSIKNAFNDTAQAYMSGKVFK